MKQLKVFKIVSSFLAVACVLLVMAVYILSTTLISRDEEIDHLTFIHQIDSTRLEILTSSPKYAESLILSKENFIKVCGIYKVHNPEIVYCQALLESGNFNSRLFISNNNFLGLYDSVNNQFFNFEHWSHCIRAYATTVQYKYNESEYVSTYPDMSDLDRYCAFLNDLPYATDTFYTKKVKALYRQHFPED